MSSPAVLAVPEVNGSAWVELDDPAYEGSIAHAEEMFSPHSESSDAFVELEPVNHVEGLVELRGRGKDRHGVLPRGGLVRLGRDPSPAPAQEDWDF